EAWVWFEVSPRIIARPEPVLVAGTAADHDDLLDVRMVMDSVRKHALVALDETGCVTSWGAGARELTGYSDEQMLGRSLSELYVPTSLGGFEKERAKAAAQGSQQGTHWIRLEDGSQFWSEVSLAAII